MERELRRPVEDDDLPFTTYIKNVPGIDFMKILRDNFEETPKMLYSWNDDQWNNRYEINKWNLKEVILHIVDTERIFAYRALRIARHDSTPLPGFEQDDYIPYLEIDHRSPSSIIEEYLDTRRATLSMFKNFSDDMMLYAGTAGGNVLTPLSIGFIIAGHEIHHLKIIRERYLGEVLNFGQ
ncbi:MAG: DinB family protein [Saprospiraceae bacterium]|nr:DinB family protein [Saprospiraceae bacterium]